MPKKNNNKTLGERKMTTKTELKEQVKHLIETHPELKTMDLDQAIYFLNKWDKINRDRTNQN